MIPQEIRIAADHVGLRGSLALPEAPRGLVLLAQVDGVHPGDRHERAARLHAQLGFATLRASLVSFQDMPGVAEHVALLTTRLLAWLAWVSQDAWLNVLPCGILATGASVPAALRASAQRDAQVKALVCCGGLPDLAGAFYLKALACPTLFLFAAADAPGLAAGARALAHSAAVACLNSIPAADREFKQARACDTVAQQSGAWLLRHLPSAPPQGIAESLPPGGDRA